MGRRICILADIRVAEKQQGVLNVFKIDSEGVGVDEPVHTESEESNDVERWYYCNNCGTKTPGADEFTMKGHLGRFHELLDPFGFP
jgi:hypothetical protein